MYTDRIYCFGDGYATGHIWPEWPQILQALLPKYQVIITAGIGAGPEWMVTRMIQQLDEIAHSRVIWQWPMAERFDKLIEDRDWLETVATDPVYHFNLLNNHDQTWWLSSASTVPKIKQYHSEYVQPAQHQQRLINYQTLVKNTLENLDCYYLCFSTQQQELYSQQARFQHIRQQQIQPSPEVHFNYCVEKILPELNLTSDLQEKLEFLIQRQQWLPYDPDSAEIWQEIKDKLI
ncbi:hypothetical protein UFOVP328_328 [uncultured Caudovirales phage]|uniref:Uncharacterized protein n=1 Tax=uncultured Caudovirales phage TaxID=2100421 RepID=A0A6J5LUJ8_9CAUD|nr:hypothetical protein UFOVP328_328 [uncultured Caudovirales phage]